ncbi:MAG: response regulator transcription factor [Chitinophagaceae bacterium]|nr:response regulator transcription factor [Chitinophagaceae bacterium]
MNTLKIAVAHDHILIRSGIANVLHSLGYEISFQAGTKEELFEQLAIEQPDIIFVVANIQSADSFQTIQDLAFHYPDIGVIALSMQDDDNAIIRMLSRGIRGYILKNSDFDELKEVIESIGQKGFHYKEPDYGRLVKYIRMNNLRKHRMEEELLTEREISFLKFLATELTYKEIAAKMFVSARTIDGYRNAICDKLKIKTRIGLVLFAIQKGIICIN